MTALGSNTCPFCGGQVYLHEKGIEDNIFDVHCLDCGMEFYYQEVFQMAIHHKGQDIKTRVNKSFHDVWNMRASDADLLAKVERLERERDALVEAIRDEGVVFFSNARMPCRYCDAEEKYTGERCRNCHNERFFGGFEWRGVKEE